MSIEQALATNDRTTSTQARDRFRFSLKQLFFAIAVFCVLLAIWGRFKYKPITVRPANDGDSIRENYFGFGDELTEKRNIAVAKGTFSKSTWLSASLIAVQNGQLQEINSFTVGRSPNQIGSPVWQRLTITLALGSRDTPNGRIVQLGSVGQSRGGGSGGDWPITFATVFADVYSGSLTPGCEYIIYAEGDAKIDMNPLMSVADFAKKNAGNYLIVTAQLR